MASPGLSWVLDVLQRRQHVPSGDEVEQRFTPAYFDGLPVNHVIRTIQQVRDAAKWQVVGEDAQPALGRERVLLRDVPGMVLVSSWPSEDPEVLRGLTLRSPTDPVVDWSSLPAGADDTALATAREEDALPGVALSVRGVASFAGVEGPEGPPVSTTTRFRAGPVTRAVTALTAVRLAEGGSLDLDAATGGGWTVRHLLTHTAGLAAAEPTVVGAPGAAALISQAGYALAGEEIAAAFGGSFEDAAQTLVLEPAGMAASTIDGAPGLAGWNRGFGLVWSTPEEAVAQAAGGLVTTIDDLAALGRAVLGSPELLVPQDERGIGVWKHGLGVVFGGVGEHRIALANGGLTDAWSAVLLLDPARELVVAALTNTNPARLEKLASDALLSA